MSICAQDLTNGDLSELDTAGIDKGLDHCTTWDRYSGLGWHHFGQTRALHSLLQRAGLEETESNFMLVVANPGDWSDHSELALFPHNIWKYTVAYNLSTGFIYSDV